MNPYDHIVIMATLDEKGFLTLDTCMNTFLNDPNFSYEYVLALLNSKLASWYYYWFVYNRAVRTMHFDEYYIGKLPVKVIKPQEQNPIINLVDKILYLKATNPEIATTHLEKEIDKLIYELYGLNEEDVRLIENQL